MDNSSTSVNHIDKFYMTTLNIRNNVSFPGPLLGAFSG